MLSFGGGYILYDILIIGGGASGLCCGAMLQGKYKIGIVERNFKVGKKLLLTGNGKCNLTNKNLTLDFYHGDLKLLEKNFKNKDGTALVGKLALPIIFDQQGRAYPHSKTSSCVLDALRMALKKNSAEEITDCLCERIYKKGNIFEVHTSKGILKSKAVVMATGGKSYPKTGSDGKGFEILKSMGIKLTDKFYPSLCPLTVKNDKFLKSLKGLRAGAECTAVSGGKVVGKQIGEVQFSAVGEKPSLSGICIFNLSTLYPKYNNLKIILDFCPDFNQQKLVKTLLNIKGARKDFPAEELLSGLVNKRVGQYLLKRLGINNCNCQEISYNKIEDVAEILKNCDFEIDSTGDFDTAQVTAGGVLAGQLDENLQVKKISGLFVCGEIININGDCGGYNLEWAWKSGQLVADGVLKYLKNFK